MEKKKIKKGSIAGFLYFIMALIVVALFIGPMKTMVNHGVNNMSTGATNYELITFIVNFFPIFFFIFMIIILIIVMRQ